MLAASAALLAGCQTVQTTRGGTVGVERTQRMSSMVSEADVREQAETSYREVLAKERQKGTLNVDAGADAAGARDHAAADSASAAFRADAAKLEVGSQRDPFRRGQRLVHAGRQDRGLHAA